MKEMKRLGKKLISGLIAMALVLVLMPDIAQKVYADASYNLWVGGAEVTSGNTSGSGNKGTWEYDNGTHTLTLTNYEYNGAGYCPGGDGNYSDYSAVIYYTGAENLTINVVGENTLINNAGTGNLFGIFNLNSDIVIKSENEGVLIVKTPNNGNNRKYSEPICASNGGIGFKDVTVDVESKKEEAQTNVGIGINSWKGITIDNSNVTSVGWYGLYTQGDEGIAIKNDSVVVAEGNFIGMYCQMINIDADTKSVLAKGNSYAILPTNSDGAFSTGIPGLGWTDTEGTTGEQAIETTAVASDIKNFKKVRLYNDGILNKLWVGGEQVTTSGQTGSSGSWKYQFGTLTLNDYSYEGDGYKKDSNYSGAIWYEGTDELTIDVVGENTINKTNETSNTNNNFGIYSDKGDINIESSSGGILGINVVNSTGESTAIKANDTGNLNINNVEVSAIGGTGGLYGYGVRTWNGKIIVSNSKLTAKGYKDAGIGVATAGEIVFRNNSIVDTYGVGEGIMGTTKIESDIKSVTIAGETRLVMADDFYGYFNTEVNGTGWTDVKGTTGKCVIPAGTNYTKTSDAIKNLKKAQFPALKEIEYTTESYNDSYDGSAHGITISVTKPESGYTVKYRTADSGEYNLTEAPTFKDAGEYTVYYQISADGYETVVDSETIVIKKASQEAPEAPTLSSATADTITLKAVDGCQYKRDDGAWQDSNVFKGLTEDTEYSFYQRKKSDENHEMSESSPASKFSTKGSDEPGETVAAPTLDEKTNNSITLIHEDGYEYSIDGGNTWQSSNVFENLEADTEYEIIRRKAASGDSEAGKISESLKVKTNEANDTKTTKEKDRRKYDENDANSGNLIAEINQDEDAVKADINLTTDVAREQIDQLTEAEKTAIKNGDDFRVYLDVMNGEKGLNDSDKERIEKDASEKYSGAKPKKYVDLKLFRQVGTNTPVGISNINSELEVSINIPDDLKNSSVEETADEESRSENLMTAAEQKTFYLVKTDAGAELVASTTGNTLTFKTKEFESIYAILVSSSEGSGGSETDPGTGTEITSGLLVAKQKFYGKDLFTKYGQAGSGYKYKFRVDNKAERRFIKAGRKYIKAKRPGKATVALYQKVKGGSWTKVEERTFTVEKPSVTKKVYNLKSGDTAYASTFITNTMQTAPTSYVSSKPSVASVDPTTGKITVHRKGRATISIIYYGSRKSAKYKTKLKIQQ
ncbi:hypothetical protein QYZ88_000070 [Lachnospiraceae bacterium C1.1]|nr:hypothetical protein [Lachnospiraceae bacterium C1.1]